MLTLSYGDRFAAPCVLALGGFDGLHLGHRALLARAFEGGLPVGITTILGGKGKALFTRYEREFLFSRAGVAFVYEIGFTEDVEFTSAEQFARQLFDCIAAEKVICGEDFRFGRGALGTPQLLKEFAKDVLVQETVSLPSGESGRKISTSSCKALLEAGDLPGLNALLQTDDFYGSAYFVQGTVEHGREVGRTYGFPTLNLSVPGDKLLAPDGVYGGLASTPQGNFPTIVNFGPRPTFGAMERKIEAYLDGFSGDLYGATVRIYPMEFYRGIQKFSDADALRTQLNKDIERLRSKEN